jgi:hypothetical protein
MNDDQPTALPPLTDGTVVERIDKKDIKPLFDPHHEHIYTRDEEETGDYFVEVCTVKNCGMGRMVAK